MGDIWNLIDELDNLRAPDSNALALLLAGLRDDCDGASLRRAVGAWLKDAVDLNKLVTMARETPTHYVWPLYHTETGFSMMINEFKDTSGMGDGYSKTVHNHRYSFASLMLAGGYTEQRSEVTFSKVGSLATWIEEPVIEVNECDVNSIDHRAFHKLIAIRDRTMTLLLKAPPEKPESISVDFRTRRVVRHVPVETRVAQLVSALS